MENLNDVKFVNLESREELKKIETIMSSTIKAKSNLLDDNEAVVATMQDIRGYKNIFTSLV